MENRPEITCDRCVAPGTCCKSFYLNIDFPLGYTFDKVREYIRNEKGYPFEPLRRNGVYAGQHSDTKENWWYEHWLFSCPKVTPEGRCSIYEDRPQLCKDYQAGSDAMCVHMAMPNGEPIIPQLPIMEV